MKIEKINNNQIKCTLTKEDLVNRQLKISELAYGTEKAKSLFRDMMQQAAYEFGFDAEDIPLMIEAIPLSSECIVLIITKVEDPEELDTRFSRFSPYSGDSAEDSEPVEEISYSAEDVLGFFANYRKVKASLLSASKKKKTSFIPLPEALAKMEAKADSLDLLLEENSDEDTIVEMTDEELAAIDALDMTNLYVFRYLDHLIRLAHVIDKFYNGVNSLYKNPKNGIYSLVISKSHHTPEQFNKVCNVLSEYGRPEKFFPAQAAYYEEHYSIIAHDNALQRLAKLSVNK